MIPRDTLTSIIGHYHVPARDALAAPTNPRNIPDVIAAAIGSTGYLHGCMEGNGDPWDYTCEAMAHAIAEHFTLALAHAYRENYAHGTTRGAADHANGHHPDYPRRTPLNICPDCAQSLSTDCPDCGGYGIIPTHPSAGITHEPCHACRDTPEW